MTTNGWGGGGTFHLLYELPWAGMWQRRCTATVEPNPSGYWGRCDLRRGHGPDVDHALERGLDFPRWSTRWTA